VIVEQDAHQNQANQLSPTNQGSGNTQTGPAKRLIEVLPRKVVIGLAVGSFFGAVGLCAVCILDPAITSSGVARFFVCLLAAFLFAVFVFTLFPADYKLDLAKTSIPLVLVGPAALWIGLLFLLLKLLPTYEALGKVLKPAPGAGLLGYTTTWVLSWTPAEPVYYKIESSRDRISQNSTTLLEGFYVQFDDKHDKYSAVVGSGPSIDEIFQRYQIEFNRADSTFQLKPWSGEKEGKK
jgi:hypothetical protein